VFGGIEEPIPRKDFRPLDEQSPELDEVAIARALAFQRAGKAAGMQIEAIARYPSPDGAARAIEWLEHDANGIPKTYEKLLKQIIATGGAPAQAALRKAIAAKKGNVLVMEKLLKKSASK
jgi:hypothetical protein